MMRSPAATHLRNHRSRRSEAEPHWYGSVQSLVDQGVVACQACALVEPAGLCLVTSAPLEPVGSVAGRLGVPERGGEQPPDVADGERDQPRVSGWHVAWSGRRRGLCAGALPELGGGDGADREGGQDQDGVAEDRGVEAGLALVQAEAALGELEAFLHRPAKPRCPEAGSWSA